MTRTLDDLDVVPDFSSPAFVSAYDELPLWSAMFGLLLLENVPMRNARKVLDVGCGTGFPLIELAERLGPEAEVHGLDPWAAGLTRAAEKIAARGTVNAFLHEGSADAMPFADASFDLIVSNLGVGNFDNREKALAECRRVVREKGSIALTTNLQGHMQEFYEVFEAVLRSRGKDTSRLNAHIQHRATVGAVEDLLEGAGFLIRRVVLSESKMRFATGTALLHHHFIKLGFLPGWKEVAGGDRETFTRIEAGLNEIAAERGELSLTIPMAYIEAGVRG